MAALLVVVLVAVVAVTGAYAYVSLLASPKFPSVPDKVGRWTRAVEISRETAETEGYWALDDPDEYVLLAINHPNAWTYLEHDAEFRFPHQTIQHDYLWNVEFEGRYFAIESLFLDPKPKPDDVGQWIQAVEISRETADERGFWVLEDPDPCILLAMSYLNSWIRIETGVKFKFPEQTTQHGWISNIEYEGHYYSIGNIFADPKL